MHPHGEHHEHGGPDTTGRHGMLLFGDEVLYMSHLPMFMHPHNYQVLLEVEFDDATLRTLRADRESASGIHTFDPAPFPIAEFDPDSGDPVRTSITGTLVRGHFERGGTPIATDVTVDVRAVVRFSKLDTTARPTPNRELGYLCFGRGGRMYLAHEITERPNYDHMLAVRLVPGTVVTGGPPQSDDVASFVFNVAQPVRFDRGDAAVDRLVPGEIATAQFPRTVSLGGAHGFAVKLEVEDEVYIEIGELS
jgi:hypothetical protein